MNKKIMLAMVALNLGGVAIANDNVLFSGEYNYNIVHIIGTNRNKDIGIYFNIPRGSVVNVNKLIANNVFVGFIKTGEGELNIKSYTISNYGGDSFNIKGSNVSISDYIMINPTPTRPYNTVYAINGVETVADAIDRVGAVVFDANLLSWETCKRGKCIKGYHQDVIGQIFPVKSNRFTRSVSGFVENITIERITLKGVKKHKNPDHIQGLVLNGDGVNINLGVKHLNIDLNVNAPFIFRRLSNSNIGNPRAQMGGDAIFKGVDDVYYLGKPYRLDKYDKSQPDGKVHNKKVNPFDEVGYIE